MKPRAFGLTDVGRCREVNQDELLIDPALGLYAVADGMGGHAAGEVASRVATEEIVRAFRSCPGDADETWPEHWDPARSAVANQIVDSIISGHQQVTLAMSSDADLKGMGTTVVVAAHQPGHDTLVVCHVGDSRAYRLRNGILRRAEASALQE